MAGFGQYWHSMGRNHWMWILAESCQDLAGNYELSKNSTSILANVTRGYRMYSTRNELFPGFVLIATRFTLHGHGNGTRKKWTNTTGNNGTLRKIQKILVALGKSENTFEFLQWVSMRNRYFQAQGKIETICLKNNITEIYFIMDRSKLRFCFYSMCRDGSDILRFPSMKSTMTMWFFNFCLLLLGNLSISELSLVILQKLKHSLDLSIMKYISVILFWRQMASILPHAQKYLFLIDTYCKSLNVFSDFPKITCIFWTFLRVNGIWFPSLSQVSVNISVQHYLCPLLPVPSLYLFQSRSNVVWINHKLDFLDFIDFGSKLE